MVISFAMGLLSILARAFGLVPPVVPREPEPFALGDSARKRLAQLPVGTIVIVSTTPMPGGRLPVVREVASDLPVDPSLGVVIDAASRDAMRGLVLEYDGTRFYASLALRVEPRETPNPESRLYEVDRLLAHGKPRFFASGSDAPPLARRVLAIPGVSAVLFRDNAVSVQRQPGLGWAVLDRSVDAALREHFLACGDPLPEMVAASAHDGLHGRVAQLVADRIAPAIHADGGDIEIVDVQDGVVHVHLIGACESCPAADATLKLGVERTLREAFPGEVQRVVSI